METFVFEGPRGRVRAAAAAIGGVAQPGDVVALEGPLGAGKTVFAQALARGAGVSPKVRVASPTFALVHDYVGRLPVHHADLYRLSGPDELAEIGLFSIGADGLVIVEWPDRAGAELPASALFVTIERTAPLRRRVTLRGHGDRTTTLIFAAKERLERDARQRAPVLR